MAELRQRAPRRGLAASLLALLLPPLGLGYALWAASQPLLGRSWLAVACLSLLFVVSLACALAPRRDALDPCALLAAVWLLVYCVAPALAGPLQWHLVGSVPTLLAQASALSLVAFLLVLAGYHLPSLGSRRPGPHAGIPCAAWVPAYALALFAVGLLGYLGLVARAGGLGGIVGGGENRVEFAKGAGYLLHASLLMLSGGALFFATAAEGRGRRAWLRAWPLALAFGLLVLLQNRSRAFHAGVIFLVISHYRIRPLRRWQLLPYGAAALIFFVLVGHARHPEVRPLLLSQPTAVLLDAAEGFGASARTFVGFSLNRLQQILLALDSFPDRASHEWGLTLLAFVNPLVRLLGLHQLQIESLGHRFFELARPELPSWLQTGYHPSLLGEMLANFPWPLALLVLPAYGIALRLLHRRLILERSDAVSLALYAVTVFWVVDMVVVGVGQLLFGIAVVALPIQLARWLGPRGSRARRPVPEGEASIWPSDVVPGVPRAGRPLRP